MCMRSLACALSLLVLLCSRAAGSLPSCNSSKHVPDARPPGVSLAAACGGFGGGASGSTAAATSGAWSGRVEVHRSDPVARSAFVELLEEQEHLSYDEMGGQGRGGRA